VRFLEQRLTQTQRRATGGLVQRAGSLGRLRRAPVLGARRFALGMSRHVADSRPKPW
jgi:hypothetical protein